MPAKRDYYEVLGVSRTASADELRKAYRKLAMQYHPDRNPGDKATAEAKFKELSEAYEILGDTEKRKRYDQFGHEGIRSDFGPGGFNFERDFTHFSDLQDILGSIFGEGGGMFQDFFGGAGARRGGSRHPGRGSDLQFDLEIDFEEAAFGSEREVTLPVREACAKCGGSGLADGAKPETCRQCGGNGVVVSASGFFHVRQTCPACGGSGTVISNPCPECQGAGRTRVRRRISLRIPPGVETGSRLRLTGKGEPGLKGGAPGDLYVIIHVRPHEMFLREGEELLCELPIPFDIATLGGEVQVPTLEGFAKLKIDAGTESGQVFRLRGKGMPGIGGRARGDLHVRARIEVPSRLSSSQKRIVRELREALDESNHPLARRVRDLAARFYERRDQLRKSQA